MVAAAKSNTPVAILETTVQEVACHNQLQADHGYNCSCMDEYIRRIRVLLTGLDVNTQERIRYILRTASRW